MVPVGPCSILNRSAHVRMISVPCPRLETSGAGLVPPSPLVAHGQLDPAVAVLLLDHPPADVDRPGVVHGVGRHEVAVLDAVADGLTDGKYEIVDLGRRPAQAPQPAPDALPDDRGGHPFRIEHQRQRSNRGQTRLPAPLGSAAARLFLLLRRRRHGPHPGG